MQIIGESNQDGDLCAILGAQAILNISEFYGIGWKRAIDYTALAKLRGVDKLSMDEIAAELRVGTTAVIRHVRYLRKNRELIGHENIRLLVDLRKS